MLLKVPEGSLLSDTVRKLKTENLSRFTLSKPTTPVLTKSDKQVSIRRYLEGYVENEKSRNSCTPDMGRAH